VCCLETTAKLPNGIRGLAEGLTNLAECDRMAGSKLEEYNMTERQLHNQVAKLINTWLKDNIDADADHYLYEFYANATNNISEVYRKYQASNYRVKA
jgi:hypothetical protein